MADNNKFHRQPSLIKEVEDVQKACPHTLVITQTNVVCIECGALWIK
jgi:hypothetical protein